MDDDAAIYVAWALSAVVLILGAAWAGKAAGRGVWGLVRSAGSGKTSLTNLQLTLWTIVILSLLSGMFFGRLFAGVDDPLSIEIPSQLLGIMGISLGSAIVSTGIARSDATPSRTAPALKEGQTRGTRGVRVSDAVTSDAGGVDISRFQNLWLTFLLAVAYLALAISFISGKTPEELTSLPAFDESLTILLGISHAGYLGTKTFNG